MLRGGLDFQCMGLYELDLLWTGAGLEKVCIYDKVFGY